ncbi:hypothetical protein BDQ17DRAFT_1423919 [Cyathus striatus]|nr:hypothetical protein BDQ17DRAFT_1423919 [Cyathus striatus]
MMLIAALSTVALAFIPLITPSPVIDSNELLVFNPNITYPYSNVIWHRGSTYNVTWETDKIPTEAAENAGVVLLGHSGNNSENLDIAHPLATDFFLRDGSVLVKAPEDIPGRKDYFVVLFGDSGNKSPEFEIC